MLEPPGSHPRPAQTISTAPPAPTTLQSDTLDPALKLPCPAHLSAFSAAFSSAAQVLPQTFLLPSPPPARASFPASDSQTTASPANPLPAPPQCAVLAPRSSSSQTRDLSAPRSRPVAPTLRCPAPRESTDLPPGPRLPLSLPTPSPCFLASTQSASASNPFQSSGSSPLASRPRFLHCFQWRPVPF